MRSTLFRRLCLNVESRQLGAIELFSVLAIIINSQQRAMPCTYHRFPRSWGIVDNTKYEAYFHSFNVKRKLPKPFKGVFGKLLIVGLYIGVMIAYSSCIYRSRTGSKEQSSLSAGFLPESRLHAIPLQHQPPPQANVLTLEIVKLNVANVLWLIKIGWK